MQIIIMDRVTVTLLRAKLYKVQFVCLFVGGGF